MMIFLCQERGFKENQCNFVTHIYCTNNNSGVNKHMIPTSVTQSYINSFMQQRVICNISKVTFIQNFTAKKPMYVFTVVRTLAVNNDNHHFTSPRYLFFPKEFISITHPHTCKKKKKPIVNIMKAKVK